MNNPASTRRHTTRFSPWYYVILLLVLTTSVVYALPNLYGSDPSLTISSYHEKQPIHPSRINEQVTTLLNEEKIPFKSSRMEKNQVIVRFDNVDNQFKAFNAVSKAFPRSLKANYLLASRSPQWLSSMGATPMQLGLDLQGGIHLQYQVDLDQAIKKAQDRYMEDYRLVLQGEGLRYISMTPLTDNKNHGMVIELKNGNDYHRAKNLLRDVTPELVFSIGSQSEHTLEITIPDKMLQEIKRLAMEKNISVFRSRADLLGVSEPLIQKKGEDRIIVELPGVQDTKSITDLLGSTATLEFRLVYED